jgi:hypothetical protein
MKARKLLRYKGVLVDIVKIDGSESGCSHGLTFDEIHMFTVASTLKENRIPYSVYKG